MEYLKIHLSGVLQYFSDTETVALRTTYNSALYPTKKAIIGLIASALGYERNSNDSLELYNNLMVKYQVIRKPIIVEDFQTIRSLKSQNNYMNRFYKRNQFTTIDGKSQDRQLTKNIQYLQDAEYDVFIGADDAKLLEIYNALRNPTYALYIGKRSCVPNKPLVTDYKLYSKEELVNVYDCP